MDFLGIFNWRHSKSTAFGISSTFATTSQNRRIWVSPSWTFALLACCLHVPAPVSQCGSTDHDHAEEMIYARDAQKRVCRKCLILLYKRLIDTCPHLVYVSFSLFFPLLITISISTSQSDAEDEVEIAVAVSLVGGFNFAPIFSLTVLIMGIKRLVLGSAAAVVIHGC